MKNWIMAALILLMVTGQAAGQTATPPAPLASFTDDSAPPVHFLDWYDCLIFPGQPLQCFECNWTVIQNSLAFGGSYHQSGPDEFACRVLFSFIGDGLALYGWTNYYGDSAALLTIDGQSPAIPVSFYSPSLAWQQKVFEVTGLGYGLHTASLRGSGSDYVNLDAIHIPPYGYTTATPPIVLTVWATVTGQAPAAVTPAWRSVADYDGQAYAVDYSANAGQVVAVVFKAAVLLVVIILAAVLMRGGGLL